MGTSRNRPTLAKSKGCSRRARSPRAYRAYSFRRSHQLSAPHPSGDEAASGCARSPRCAGQACVQRIPPEAGPHARRHPGPQRRLVVDEVLALPRAGERARRRRARHARGPGARARHTSSRDGRTARSSASATGRRARTSTMRARSRTSCPWCAARSATGRSPEWATGWYTAGLRSGPRCASTMRCWRGSRRSYRSRPCTSRTTSPRSAPCASWTRRSRRWPASTPRSTAHASPGRALRAARGAARGRAPPLRLPRALLRVRRVGALHGRSRARRKGGPW